MLISIFSSRGRWILINQAKIWQFIRVHIDREDLDEDVLPFLGITAEPYVAKPTMAKFMDNAIPICITQSISKMDRVVSTQPVVLETLNTILFAY
jgi:hypothetical protein